MKTISLFVGFVFALAFSSATVPDGKFFKSARALDNCQGQETSRNWYFTVGDTDGRKINFGPYQCKNVCSEARNNEARKMKWVIASACEEGNNPVNNALSQLVDEWQAHQKKLDEFGVEYRALDERIPRELDRWQELKNEAEAALLDYERRIPEIKKRSEALKARELELNGEYDSYFSACNREVEDAQEAANCSARFDRYTAAHANLSQDFDQLDFEVLTLNNRVNRALAASKNLGDEIQEMEERKNYLFDEGIITHIALIQLAPKIQELATGDQVLPYLDPVIFRQIESIGEVCRPFEFVNSFDYENCYLYFRAGEGPYAEAVLSRKDE